MAEETKDLSPASEKEEESDAEEEMDTKEENEKDDVKPDKEEKKEDKESEKEDDEEEDEESEEEEELQAGLLERPVVIEDGRKRERKKVERMTFQSPENEEKKDYVEEGKGRRLGEIPYVEYMLSKTKTEDCKPLHRVLFRRMGQMTTLKRRIRKFSGFPFSEDDEEYEKRVKIMKENKFKLKMVKTICDILDIPKKGGTKDELIERVMKWLQKPEDSKRNLPQKRKRGSKGKGKSEKGKDKKKKATKSKAKPKKSKATADDDDDDDDDDDEDETKDEKEEESEESEEEQSEEESEEEEEPPKKKAKKATPPKAKPKEKKPKEKPAPKPKKATPKKKATPVKKKKVASDDEVSDISSDSDDEPLQTHVKPKAPPTNDELKDVVKKMLENANLEEVTMKTVLKDVYGKYPSFDLSDRKEFIKNTVKQQLS